MKESVLKWWRTERVDRVERGTSQDVCPTNGGAVIYVVCITLFWILLFGFIFCMVGIMNQF